MTKKELLFIQAILNRIKDPDEQIAKAQAFINKDLANYASRKGQLKEMYEHEWQQY